MRILAKDVLHSQGGHLTAGGLPVAEISDLIQSNLI